jgi:L-alanine-DL-glutamate epimerase-like enolase superfamily enzyme
MFKQLLQAGSIQFCQIDSCRLAGPNEILTVYLMADKFNGKFMLFHIDECITLKET